MKEIKKKVSNFLNHIMVMGLNKANKRYYLEIIKNQP